MEDLFYLPPPLATSPTRMDHHNNNMNNTATGGEGGGTGGIGGGKKVAGWDVAVFKRQFFISTMRANVIGGVVSLPFIYNMYSGMVLSPLPLLFFYSPSAPLHSTPLLSFPLCAGHHVFLSCSPYIMILLYNRYAFSSPSPYPSLSLFSSVTLSFLSSSLYTTSSIIKDYW